MSEYLLAIYMWAGVVGIAVFSTFLYWLGGETAKALGLHHGAPAKAAVPPPSFHSHPHPSSPGA